MLKHLVDGRLRESFFGRFEAGEAVIGVIDAPGGYIAGRFANGGVIASQDRNLVIQAFDAASQAAMSVSASFKRNANASSAAFYRRQASKLARQMD